MEIVLLIIVLCYVWYCIDPKLDWNYETGERILWFNDPFSYYSYGAMRRRSTVLYVDKSKIKN